MERKVFYTRSFLNIKNPSLFLKFKNKFFFNLFNNIQIMTINSKLFIVDFNNLYMTVSTKDNKANSLKMFINYFFRYIQGLNMGFYVKLKLVGLGFKLKRVFLENKQRYLKISLGFSHNIFYKVPNNINVFVKKKFFFLQSSNFNVIMSFIRQIQSFRQLNPYKEKGILLYNQKLKLKSGKQQQK
jgi:ribosomal protein L6P/L9E